MRKKMLALGIAGCLLFCACAGNGATGNKGTEGTGADNSGSVGDVQSPETEAAYVLNEMTVPDAALGEFLPEGAEKTVLLETLAGEEIYRLLEIYPNAGEGSYEEVNYCVQVLEPPYEEWTTVTFTMEEYVKQPGSYVQDAYMETDRTIKMLIKSAECDYIGSWNKAGGFTAKEMASDVEWETVFEGKQPVWFDGGEKGLFFLNEEIVLRYDENGQKQETTMEKTGGLVFLAVENPFSNQLYFCGADAESWSMMETGLMVENGGFSIWTADEKTPAFTGRDTGNGEEEDNFFLDGDGSCVAFSGETEGYLCNRLGIYRFSMEEKSYQEVYNFGDKHMGARVRRMTMSVKEDGTLLLLMTYQNGRYWFARLQKEEQTTGQKLQLELAVQYASPYLTNAVIDFNRQSAEYEIVLRTRPQQETAYDYRNRIWAELSAGNGPDIMGSDVLETRVGAEKGILLDLTEYYAMYQGKLFPAAEQLGKEGDKYYGIPYTFNVMTLVADKDVVGNRQDWNLEEAMQCMEESGADTFFEQTDVGNTYFYLGILTENTAFIDWENHISYLNGEAGCQLLEFSTKYSVNDTDISEDSFERVAKGESLTGILYFTTPELVQYMSERLQGREVYIGFPTEDHTGGHCLIGDVLEINSNTKSVEGAMKFIDYLLSDNQQVSLANAILEGHTASGYPVLNDLMDTLYDSLCERAEEAREENILSLTPGQYEALWQVLRSARFYGNKTGIVQDILLEEAGAYWAGTKTAGQVMDIVNERIQLYLAE